MACLGIQRGMEAVRQMKTPQLENGYTTIANEIVEALAHITLTAYETRVLWALLRKTYGWHKKSDRISYSQWEQMTGLNRRHLGRTLIQLAERKIITIASRGNNVSLEYSFQKDYSKWITTENRHELLPQEATGTETIASSGRTIASRGNETIASLGNHKRKKETKQKKEGIVPSDFLKEMTAKFPGLDIDAELEKFQLYWTEGKRQLRRPKLAFLNWLNKAVEINKDRRQRSGTHKGSDRAIPSDRKYTDPDTLRYDED